jgi:hypothetical protein
MQNTAADIMAAHHRPISRSPFNNLKSEIAVTSFKKDAAEMDTLCHLTIR